MVLATHAVAGAAVASLFPEHPVLGFALGFGSHFMLDAIPHWDYSIRTNEKLVSNPLDVDIKMDLSFLPDLIKIGSDALLGVLVALLVFSTGFGRSPLLVAAGAFSAMLPDFLQFAYMKYRKEPMLSLQKFHQWIHSEIKMKDRPAAGVILQILLVSTVVLAFAVLTGGFR